MSEQEFKNLLIEMVTMGKYEQKEEIIALLKICNITFEKTGYFAYSGVWNQRKEYIYLSIIPSKLGQLKQHSKYLKKCVMRFILLVMSIC